MSPSPLPRFALPPGLRVLITAGAAGIGRAMAGTFLEAGARVHVCDIDEAAIEGFRAAWPSAGATRADAGDPAAVDRLFAELEARLGGLDVLVNNAGIAGPTAQVEDVTPEEWREVMRINIDGQFLCARRAVPLLKRSGGGSIINISSAAGRLGFALRTPYAASKWAVVGFTKSLAKELGPHGIRANAILPGLVKSPRLEGVLRRRAEAEAVTYEEMERRYVSRVSLRRMVAQEDIASTAIFLCSPAGANVSGQALSVCGDLGEI
ncbi:MAG: SDR family oxidoreductase [Planctomycetes bacterium]|nr:SDR family oxidoreductase [Planctomycetota bacterium]